MPVPAGLESFESEQIGEQLPDSVPALQTLLSEVRQRIVRTRDTPDMRHAQRIERRIHELSVLNSAKGTEWYAGLSWWPGHR